MSNRKRAISKDAQKQFQEIEVENPELASQMREIYAEVLTNLNDQVDERLVGLVRDLVPLLRAYAPHSPSEVQALASAACALVRKFAEDVLVLTMKISNRAVGVTVMGAMQDVLSICVANTTELMLKLEALSKRKVD